MCRVISDSRLDIEFQNSSMFILRCNRLEHGCIKIDIKLVRKKNLTFMPMIFYAQKLIMYLHYGYSCLAIWGRKASNANRLTTYVLYYKDYGKQNFL